MFIITPILILLLFLFYASYSIKAGIYLKSICFVKNSKQQIALTFDDGVDAEITPKVLSVLKKHGAKATFFIIGERADAQILKQIIADGHEIGNHSLHHKWNFPMQDFNKTLQEIEATTQILESATNTKVNYFRPPFGVTNPTLAKAIKKSGLISIGWSIRSLDTIGQEIEKVTKRVTHKIKSGDIVLLHDNRLHAEQLLDQILKEIKQKGLHCVSMSTLLNNKI